jgi:hypothetical protein
VAVNGLETDAREYGVLGDQAPDLACNPLEACVGVCRRVRQEDQEQQETEDNSANHQAFTSAPGEYR